VAGGARLALDFVINLEEGSEPSVQDGEGARHPKMMSVGPHMRLVGHPARAAGLERLLDYVGRQDGVWIATHPYPGTG
jgi:hypothetical protein